MAVLGLPTASITPSAAAPLFKAPFPCGQSWTASTYPGHSNNNNAVDFNLYPGQSDLGQPALSDAPGTARSFWDGQGGNMVEIDHGGGWKTWYAHLATVSINNPIDTGEQIGTVGNTGTVSPHLHYEQRFNGVAQPVAFDGQRIAVGTTYTANDPKVTSTNCGAITPPDRDADGTPDASDRCPDQAGPTTTLGCPDNDGDAVADMDDACPQMPGTAGLLGCSEEDINPMPGPSADFDGDGRADYCRRVGGVNLQTSYLSCTLSTGDGFGKTVQSPVVDWGFDTGRAWVGSSLRYPRTERDTNPPPGTKPGTSPQVSNKLHRPRRITVKRISRTHVVVRWKPVARATGYRIRLSSPPSLRTAWRTVKHRRAKVRLHKGRHAVLSVRALGKFGAGPTSKRRL
jgi:hypothetical protein